MNSKTLILTTTGAAVWWLLSRHRREAGGSLPPPPPAPALSTPVRSTVSSPSPTFATTGQSSGVRRVRGASGAEWQVRLQDSAGSECEWLLTALKGHFGLGTDQNVLLFRSDCSQDAAPAGYITQVLDSKLADIARTEFELSG